MIVNYIVNNKKDLVYIDQEVLNDLLFHKIKILDSKWNNICVLGIKKCAITPVTDSYIIHYTTKFKPWKSIDYSKSILTPTNLYMRYWDVSGLKIYKFQRLFLYYQIFILQNYKKYFMPV